MKFKISSQAICFWLIILGQNEAESSMVMDLVNNFAFDGIHCLLLISDLNTESDDLSFVTDNVSKISLSLYDTNASLLDISASGSECIYNFLIFENVDTSLQFLNRWKYSSSFILCLTGIISHLLI